jgi:hypothetical protein
VTWPLPELDVGVEAGELRPLDDELLDELEPSELVLPVLDVAWCLPLAAEPDEEWVAALAAPGRLNATAPAAIRLAAAAETVAARSRFRPWSLAATADCVPAGGVLLGSFWR